MFTILGGDGKQYGPIPVATLREWIQQGRANAETQVLAEGATSWQALGTVAEFADLLGAAAVPADAPVADTSAYDSAVRLANPAGWALMIIGVLGILMCIAFIVFYSVKGVPANPFENFRVAGR